MQKQAITPVEEATRTLSRTDRLPRAQRDDLNNAGLIQRQVGSRISNRDEGLEQKLRRLLDDLRNFKIANPEAQQQMQDMLERLNMLRDRHLGPAEQGLTTAGKSLEQIAEPPPGAATPREAKDEAPKQAGNDGDRKDQAGAPPRAADRPQDAKPGKQP